VPLRAAARARGRIDADSKVAHRSSYRQNTRPNDDCQRALATDAMPRLRGDFNHGCARRVTAADRPRSLNLHLTPPPAPCSGGTASTRTRTRARWWRLPRTCPALTSSPPQSASTVTSQPRSGSGRRPPRRASRRACCSGGRPRQSARRRAGLRWMRRTRRSVSASQRCGWTGARRARTGPACPTTPCATCTTALGTGRCCGEGQTLQQQLQQRSAGWLG